MATAFTAFESSRLAGVKVTDRVLGRGAYATVLELEYMGLKCAGKKIHSVLLSQGEETLKHFKSECTLLSRLHHPNIVQFLGVFFEDNPSVPILVMEFLPTDLTSCMKKHGVLSNEANYSILHDVSLGLNYLHNQAPPIVHRDLTSNNVLLTSGLSAKISDLGVARIFNFTPQQFSRMTRAPGTPAYMPPEVMVSKPIYDASMDAFSFGVLIIHVFCGEWPEPQVGQIRVEAGKMIPVSEAERREKFIRSLETDHPLMPLILECISNIPHQRPSAGELVTHLAKMVEMFPNSSADRIATLTMSSSTKLSIGRHSEAESVPKQGRIEQAIKDGNSSSKTKKEERTYSPSSPSEDHEDDSSHRLRVCVAKRDYSSERVNGLSFKKGDQLYVLKCDGCWWFARSKVTGGEGYVPSYCMTAVGDLEAQEWFFSNLGRKQAEELLMSGKNQYGSYIVRNSQNGYSLSVRDTTKVRHYRIHQLKFDEGFCISKQIKFNTIVDLVAHYEKQADMLCVNLRHPYVATTVQPSSAVESSKHNCVKWEIDHGQIRLLKKIQTNEVGHMWEGMWNGKIPVTVKGLKPGSSITTSELLSEAELMKRLQNPHILRLYAVCTKEPVYIVTELVKHGSLQDYLRNDGRTLKMPKLIDMASQIAAGMTYLEEHDIIHRELMAAHVFVADKQICKVAGFHSAQAVEGDFHNAPTVSRFPIKWTAPEAALSKKYSIKSDVWSFGIVLHELVTFGHFPYAGMKNAHVLEHIQKGYRMPQPTGCSVELYSIMSSCWSQNPVIRPSFRMLQTQLLKLKAKRSENPE